MNLVIGVFKDALMITAFVFMMMLLIEYVNVLTRGIWSHGLRRGGWRQYLLAVLLGASPGCLGAFVMVTLYEHGIVSIGALIATMMATSGDEAFVMLAMIPRTFAVLTGVLVVVPFIAGIFIDWAARRCGRETVPARRGYELHAEACDCYPAGQIVQQWRECTLARGTLAITMALFVAAFALGDVGPSEWNWIRVTLLLTSAVGLFIVSTVPDHFLEEHLWQHVVKKHVPRLLAWTFGALLVTALADQHLNLHQFVQARPVMMLMIAGLVGVIPESGPHLFFVSLYKKGTIPFSVLLTSSTVQDGHGMLPLLAYSVRAFLITKGVNLALGLGMGLVAYAMGF